MRMPRRQLKTWLVATLASTVLLATGLLCYGRFLHRQARAVLDDVFTLTVAEDRETVFTALQRKYGDTLILDGCSGGYCSYHLTVSNRFLSTLLRIPYTELNVRFDLRGKLLSLVLIDYHSAFARKTSPIVRIQTDFCSGGCKDFDLFYVHPWTQVSTVERWNGMVQMSYATVAQLRLSALALNTSCLTNLRGCTDIAQLMPEIWKPTADGVRCAIPNLTGKAR